MKFPDLTIMRRIVGPFVLLILVGNMVVVTLMLNFMDEQLLIRQQQHLQSQVQQYSRSLRKETRELANRAIFLAGVPAMEATRSANRFNDQSTADPGEWLRHLAMLSRSVLVMSPDTTRMELVLADSDVAFALARDATDGGVRLTQETISDPFSVMRDQFFSGGSSPNVAVELVRLNSLTNPTWALRALAPVYTEGGHVSAFVVLQRRLLSQEFIPAEYGENQFQLANRAGYTLSNAFPAEHPSLFAQHADLQKALETYGYWSGVSDAKGESALAVQKLLYEPNNPEEYLLVIGASTHALGWRIRSDLLGMEYLVVALGGLLSSFIALAIAWKIAEPIVRMRNAVVRKGIATLDFDLPLDAGGEVGELARSFREFLAELRAREEQLQHEILQRKVALAHLEVKNDMLEFANKESEQFVYIASHDLQEPVRTVKSFVHMLQQEYDNKLDENGRQILSFLENSTTRMTELIKGLLEYSRLGKNGEISSVNIQDLVQGVCDDLALRIREQGARVEFSELPTVNAYATELRALLQNLISNALKFTRVGVPAVVQINAEQQGEEWVLSVRDNGIGIAEEHFEKIFMIFQRLHGRDGYEGSGIGLAHCKKIIEMHGGKIWLESTPGEGTTFFFTLRNQREGVVESLQGREL